MQSELVQVLGEGTKISLSHEKELQVPDRAFMGWGYALGKREFGDAIVKNM